MKSCRIKLLPISIQILPVLSDAFTIFSFSDSSSNKLKVQGFFFFFFIYVLVFLFQCRIDIYIFTAQPSGDLYIPVCIDPNSI